MNEEDSFENLFDQIIGYSMCLLYDQSTRDELLKSSFVLNNDQNDFSTNLYNWGENESETTFKELKSKHVEKNEIKQLLDKIKTLQKIIVISPNEDEPMMTIFNTLFIGLGDLIRQIYKDLNNMYKSFQLTEEEFLVDKKNFQLINPYFILEKLLSKLHTIFDLIDANNDISFEYFEFSPEFQFLPIMMNEIETENIKENDFKILKKNCCFIILEGFVFNKIWIKLDEEQLQETKKKWSFSKLQNDEQIQLCSEYENLIKYWNKLYKLEYKYNETEIKNIYKKYSKDEDIVNYLKPLIENIIPFLNKMKKSKEILNLTFEISKKYQICLKELSNGNEKLYDNDFILLLTYYPIIPFDLVDSPDSSYDDFFFDLIKKLNTVFIKGSKTQIQVPNNLKEVTKGNTLIQQKYSLIYKMMQCLKDCQKESFYNDDIFLILSLFTWKIKDDSQEARNLENYLNNSIKLHLNNYDYETNELNIYAKYIIDEVCPSKKLLKQSELDKNMAKLTAKSIKNISQKNSTCSACCIIE